MITNGLQWDDVYWQLMMPVVGFWDVQKIKRHNVWCTCKTL